MAKLRKMLGDIQDPSVIELMRLIETQNQHTLACWAIGCVEPIMDFVRNDALQEITDQVKAYLDGTKPLKEVKPLLKEARNIAKGYSEPVTCAAAYAIITALAVITTPTNALGFTFYYVAARVYHEVGLNESREVYDKFARLKFKEVVESLRNECIENETNPVKVNWNC